MKTLIKIKNLLENDCNLIRSNLPFICFPIGKLSLILSVGFAGFTRIQSDLINKQ